MGRIRNYGACYHCKGTWDWKSMTNSQIKYRTNVWMFPLCDECFEKLRYPTIMEYCLKLLYDRGSSEEEIQKYMLTISDSIIEMKKGNKDKK